MSSPALALTWDLVGRWRRSVGIGILSLLAGTLLTRWLVVVKGPNSVATVVAYSLTALVLMGAFASIHFTEGAKRGGFGGYPTRLFHLPVSTGYLVAVPMIGGAVAMVVAYLACVLFLLRPLGNQPPLLWPCLYLVAGVTHFQAVVWSLVRHPHWRLVVLGSGAAFLGGAWMFFLPEIVAGTLSDWGLGMDPESFLVGLQGALALAGPVAFGISWNRVHAQRHRRGSRRRTWPWNRGIGVPDGRAIGRSPFRSPDHALLWMEFRRTGWILPIAVAFILLLTGIPAVLGGDAHGRVTAGVVTAMAIAPLVLGMIIGCGMAKPDFWSNSLRVATFHAVLPVASGQWVLAKLVSAFASATITWGMTLLAAFVWLAWFGDFLQLESWLFGIRFYYSPAERLLLSILIPISATILTWRFLISGLASGLGGRPGLRRLSDAFTAALLALAFAFAFRNGGDEAHGFPRHTLWPWIQSLPIVLTAAVLGKMGMAAWSWDRVYAQRMLTGSSVAGCWIVWALSVGFLCATIFILCHQTIWLRSLLFLTAILCLPLARTGVAMLALARNRANR